MKYIESKSLLVEYMDEQVDIGTTTGKMVSLELTDDRCRKYPIQSKPVKVLEHGEVIFYYPCTWDRWDSILNNNS